MTQSKHAESMALNAGPVRVEILDPGSPVPIVIKPADDGVMLAEWIEHNLDTAYSMLTSVGGILFRGFDVSTPERFESAAKAFGHTLLPYTERTSARVEVREHVYTSTEHPSDQYIHFHNANSYSTQWPSLIWFGSIVPATAGGHTPLADCRAVLAKLGKEVVEEFRRRRVMYVRNFRPHIGLPWQVTFQTTDRQAVYRYCEKAVITIETFTEDHLRICQVRDAIAVHPVTGEEVWFNQAHLFHPTGLAADIKRVLDQTYGPRDLPRNAFFGDGGDIPEDMLAAIVEAYRSVEVSHPWLAGDFLALDNMLVAHGRTPFTGERTTLVAFAKLHRPERNP